MKKNLHTAVCFVVLLLFWGMFYPQYTLSQDMYQVKDSDGTVLEQSPVEDLAAISAAGPGEVTMRFWWLDKLDEWFGEKKDDEDRGNKCAARSTDRRL